jgi:SAM-dependent methyltransferase
MNTTTEHYNLNVIQHGISYDAVGYRPEECIGQYLHLKSMLRIQPGETVLDVGCGLGFGYALLTETTYTGLDASEMMINGAKLLNGNADGRFEVGDFREVDVVDYSQDYVIFSGMFNTESPWPVVTNMLRKAWKVARIGVGVAYQYAKPDVEDGVFTVHPHSRWLKLFQSFGVLTAYDSSWSTLNAVMAGRKHT